MPSVLRSIASTAMADDERLAALLLALRREGPNLGIDQGRPAVRPDRAPATLWLLARNSGT